MRSASILHSPRFHEAHFQKALGHTLLDVGRNEEALDAFRQAIRLDPRIPHGNVELARALLTVGKVAAARDALDARGGGPHTGEASPEHAALAAEIRRMMALDARLPAASFEAKIGQGRRRRIRRFRPALRARGSSTRPRRDSWAEALAARSGDPHSDDRDQAARVAAMACVGHGKDVAPTRRGCPSKRWRDQALDWLEAERVALAQLIETGSPQAQSRYPKTRRGALAGRRCPGRHS